MDTDRYHHIDNDELSRLLQDGAAIVDVRRPEEWAQTGVIAGSELLTFFTATGQSNPQEWLAQLDQLVPPEQPLLLI